MSKSKKYEIDMCNGPIISKLLLFAGPLVFSSILQIFFNAADVVVVGKFAGDNSLGAVGSVGPVTNLIVNLFLGLSIGTNVMSSRFFGAKDNKGFSDTLHTSMAISGILGIVLGVISIIATRQICVWMGFPEEVIDLATVYLRIYFIGIPAQSVYNFGSAILRATGDTKRPMYYLMGAGVINVILNLIFVIVLRMDVAGVGLATIIAQYISAILVVRCLLREEGILRLQFSKLTIDTNVLMKIIRIGVPASVQGIMFSISNVIIQASVNSFGAVIVAGNSAAANIEGFVYVSMNAFYQACMTFVSTNVGARKFHRINSIVIKAEIIVTIVGITFGNIMYLLGNDVLYFYTDSAEVVDAGMIRMACVLVPYFLCGMMDVMVGAIRGLGYAIMPMIVTIIGVCGVRLFWIFTFFKTPRFHETKYLYLTYPVTWSITFLAHVICFVIVKRKFDERIRLAEKQLS